MATAKKTTKKKVDVAKEVAEPKAPKEVEFIETGDIGLDLALTNGKGIPLGSNIMFFGKPGHGKTTIFGDMIKRLLVRYQKANIPFRIHYIDSENSRELLTSLGVFDFVYDNEDYAPQQVIYHPNVQTFEEAEEILDRIVGKIVKDKLVVDKNDVWRKDVKLIFIDSMTNLISKTQLANNVDKADYGDNAKARKKFYLKYLARLREFGSTTFWTSQVSVKQNILNQYEDPNKLAASEFDQHNMEIIVKLVKSTDSKRTELKKVKVMTIDGEQEVQTRYITKLYPGQVQYTKNRFGQDIPVEILVKPGKYVINAFTIKNVLEMNKCIKMLDKDTWTMCDDLATYLGPDVLKDLDPKALSPRDVNIICSNNTGKLVKYAKDREIYKVTVGEAKEPDDGLY